MFISNFCIGIFEALLAEFFEILSDQLFCGFEVKGTAGFLRPSLGIEFLVVGSGEFINLKIPALARRPGSHGLTHLFEDPFA